jgi:hypothetical protein
MVLLAQLLNKIAFYPLNYLIHRREAFILFREKHGEFRGVPSRLLLELIFQDEAVGIGELSCFGRPPFIHFCSWNFDL